MGRVFTSVLALIVSHGLVVVSPIMAQPPDRWGSLVGNWNMEFAGKDGKPLAKGYFAFHADQTPTQRFVAVTGPGGFSGVLSETSIQDKQLRCQDGSFVGGTLKLDCWPYSFFYLTLRLSADGNTLRGTWTNSRTGEPDGLVRWTRARRPTIDKVEVRSDDGVALDHAKMEQAWASGGRPQLRLSLQGRDLPIWIDTGAEARKDIAIDDPNYRIVHESLSINNMRARWKQGAFEVVVQMEPGARPGRKVITVNGSEKTFEILFRNYREASKVVELRFVRKDGSPLSEIGYGEPFHLEARFDVPPPEAERIVKLDWRGGARDIPVVKQEDAKVFRSGLLYLEAPTMSTETPPNR